MPRSPRTPTDPEHPPSALPLLAALGVLVVGLVAFLVLRATVLDARQQAPAPTRSSGLLTPAISALAPEDPAAPRSA